MIRRRLLVTEAFTALREADQESSLEFRRGLEIWAAIGEPGPTVKFTFDSRPGFFVIDRETLETHTQLFQSK